MGGWAWGWDGNMVYSAMYPAITNEEEGVNA